MSGRRVLFVHGLEDRVTVRDLVFEFERFGPVKRCDISRPTGRNGGVYSITSPTNWTKKLNYIYSHAFVELLHSRDADDAFRRIHGRRFRGGTIKVEWAKRMPRSFKEEDDELERATGRGRSRSRSPSRHSGRRETAEAGNADDKNRAPSRSRSPMAWKKSSSDSGDHDRVSSGEASQSPIRSPGHQ